MPYDPNMISTEPTTDALSPTTIVLQYLKSKGIPLNAGNISQALRDHAGDPNAFRSADAPGGLTLDRASTEAEDQAAMAAAQPKRSAAPAPASMPGSSNRAIGEHGGGGGVDTSAPPAADDGLSLAQRIMLGIAPAIGMGLPFLNKGPRVGLPPAPVVTPPTGIEAQMQKAIAPGLGSALGNPALSGPASAAAIGGPAAAAALPGPRAVPQIGGPAAPPLLSGPPGAVPGADPNVAIPLPRPGAPDIIPLPKPTVRVQAGSAPVSGVQLPPPSQLPPSLMPSPDAALAPALDKATGGDIPTVRVKPRGRVRVRAPRVPV